MSSHCIGEAKGCEKVHPLDVFSWQFYTSLNRYSWIDCLNVVLWQDNFFMWFKKKIKRISRTTFWCKEKRVLPIVHQYITHGSCTHNWYHRRLRHATEMVTRCKFAVQLYTLAWKSHCCWSTATLTKAWLFFFSRYRQSNTNFKMLKRLYAEEEEEFPHRRASESHCCQNVWKLSWSFKWDVLQTWWSQALNRHRPLQSWSGPMYSGGRMFPNVTWSCVDLSIVIEVCE